MATVLQSLLALYGALDLAVTETGDPDIEAAVEQYLPGTTGANAGWYEQLLNFLADPAYLPAGIEPLEVPDLREALMTLQETGPAQLKTVELSRMVYAIGALCNLPSYYPPDEWDDEFSRTLALARPRGGEEVPDIGLNLLLLLRFGFHSRPDFPRIMQQAAQLRWIDNLVALVPLCQTKCKWVRGHLCVVLTTEFPRDDISLDDVKNVIDPLNWNECLSFFCEMEYYPPCPDGWSRVLEHVSETCSIPGTQMVTPLKYFKGQQQQPEPTAWIDYELDDQPAAGETGDGRMVVDEGFIRMRSTVGNSAAKGVRVRTRKVAGFRNLAYVPAAIFACVMGYGDQGVAMVLDGVANRALAGGVGWISWEPSVLVAHAGPPPPPGDKKSAEPTASDGGDPSRRAMTLAVDMLNECIDDMSKKSAAIASKWATGVVPIAETMSFSSDMAIRLATDPWRYLERLRNPTQGSGK